ncbi:MAG: hypothetical protein KIT60_17865 [Burkholderiaceae bacterium]|nr:hypothetical protein [Burkholderiaceae bacterium]
MAAYAPSSYSRAAARPLASASTGIYRRGIRSKAKEHVMGKYVLAWALGAPAIVVVIAYLVFG